MKGAITAVAVAATLAFAPAAGAASFTIAGGDLFALASNFNPSGGAAGLAPGTSVTRNGTLSLDGRGRVSFSYVGSEAGYANTFWAAGLKGFDNKSGPNAPFTLTLGPGAAPFEFRTASPAGSVANGESSGYYKSIAFYQSAPSTVYALFNDASTSDRDYDDLVVRMDVAPVPLPAAAWLLLGGLAGLGALKRGARRA